MSIPYSAFVGRARAEDTPLRQTVAVATRTFRRHPATGRIAALLHRLAVRMIDALTGPSAFQGYDVERRHAGAAAMHRMANELDGSQPALAAELRLMACRNPA